MIKRDVENEENVKNLKMPHSCWRNAKNKTPYDQSLCLNSALFTSQKI